MMKLTEINAQNQAATFMLGKVENPYITWYINAMITSTLRTHAKFSVIPDLYAVNYVPTGNA